MQILAFVELSSLPDTASNMAHGKVRSVHTGRHDHDLCKHAPGTPCLQPLLQNWRQHFHPEMFDCLANSRQTPVLRVIQAIEQMHAPRLTRIRKPLGLLAAQLVNLSEIVRRKGTLCRLKILLNVRLMTALRDDARSAGHAPLQHDLSRRTPPLLRNALHDFILKQQRRLSHLAVAICRIHVTERGVRGNRDTVRLMRVNPLRLREVRMELHLVHRGERCVAGQAVLDQLFELRWREVAYADAADFTGREKRIHGEPCRDVVVGVLLVVGAFADGPVHEVEI